MSTNITVTTKHHKEVNLPWGVVMVMGWLELQLVEDQSTTVLIMDQQQKSYESAQLKNHQKTHVVFFMELVGEQARQWATQG